MKQIKRLLPVLAVVLVLLAVLALTTLGADAEPYAVYNSADQSLTFCVGTKTDAGVVRADGSVVAGDEYYTGFAETRNSYQAELPWHDKRGDIKTVSFFDPITPVSIGYWFTWFNNLTSIKGLEKLDTSKARLMTSVFFQCQSLTELDVRGFDTSKATDMLSMFAGCSNLKKLDVSGFDTSNVDTMTLMFEGCSKLTALDVSNFDISKVSDMREMFKNCSSLTELDFSSFDTSRAYSLLLSVNMRNMLDGCTMLSRLILGEHFYYLGGGDPNLPNPPSTYPNTGKWVREDGTGKPYSSSYLIPYKSSRAGIYVWETLAKRNAAVATCTEGSHSEYYVSMVTGKYYSDSKGENEIKEETIFGTPLGHAWGSWTKLNDQQHYRVCSRDTSHTETQSHVWSGWETIKNPTESTPGLEERTCTICKTAHEQREIPKLGQNVIVDEETKIRIQFDTWAEGDPDINLIVQEKDRGEISIPGIYSYESVDAWDIKPVNDSGDVVQPSKPVKVWIPLLTGFNRNSIVVYHKHTQDPNDVERVEDISFETIYDVEYVVFYTDSFSTFIIVDTSSKTNPQPDPNMCHWCGQVHEGFFQKIIGFFHNIFAKLFGAKY